MSSWIQGCCLLFIFFIHNIGIAQEVIPETLKPWQEWVLRYNKEHSCPRAYHQSDTFLCHWPSEVDIKIQTQEAAFNQKGALYQAGWVMLAGDNQYWPDDVKVNNQFIPVIEKKGRPFVFLDKGYYEIEGKFKWERIPDRIAVPDNSGLVHITINQNQINLLDRDRNGYVWLRKISDETSAETAVDSIQLRVYRKLQDSIPQEMLTLLKIVVTGKERETTIGPVIDDQQVPISINTPLPARLEKNGTLRIQVKPGAWEIYLTSRYLKQTDQFSYLQTSESWPNEEIWSFEAQPQYRQVEVNGPLSIDPIQAEVPQSWRQFPAYLMKAEVPFVIDEKQRGKIFERGEQLSLERTMWLDLDGKGMTLQDQITGTIEDHWRLSTVPPLAIGRVSINNEDQLITILKDNEQPGVEIRNSHLYLTATSRIDKNTQTIPAIGWNRDVNRLHAILQLPPGWKLLNAFGVDKVSNAWVRNWNLLDLFLVLLIGLSVFKLFSIKHGIFALITIGLIYQEPTSPIYSWLAVLVGLALLRVMSEGNAKQWTRVYTLIASSFLILMAIPFIGTQLQTALYPQLNDPDKGGRAYLARNAGAMLENAADLDAIASSMPSRAMGALHAPVQQLKSQAQADTLEQAAKKMQDYDPDAKIQTGPGIPDWTWNRVELSWQGPVSQDQNIRLWLLPAWIVSILKFIQVFLVMGFIVLLVRALRPYFKGGLMNRKNYPTTASRMMTVFLLPLVVVFFNICTVKTAFADIPSPTLLNELREYLLRAPECAPNCADYDKAQLTIEGGVMTLRLGVQVIDNVAIPLPHNEKGWLLKNILLNSEPVKALQQDEQGILWIYLEKGSHELIVTGILTPINVFELSFKLLPKSISLLNAPNSGWSVNGINDDHKMTGTSLQFSRIEEGAQQGNTLIPTEMPPFVEFKRTIRLGLEWDILNELRRISPSHDAMHINLSLLKGEKILSSLVKVKDNQLQVQLAEGQHRVQWQSKLDLTSPIELQAIASTAVKEVWRLQALPMWHVNFSGLPVIHQQSNVGQWLPEWHPWPTEHLQIEITKPQALKGNTLTIDSSRYLIKPGKRKTEHELLLNIRSSLGAQHVITLPESIKVQDVMIQNLSQPIHLEGNQLNIPIYPGIQNVSVRWESSTELKTKTTTPNISIAEHSTNHVTEMNISNDRWILWLSGPQIGPVVQFWSVLCLTLVIAIALGASGLTPLATWQWVLLGLGVTLTTPFAALVVIAWFIALHFREQVVGKTTTTVFQLYQIFIVILTGLFIISLLVCIKNGLLGNPQMQLSVPETDLINRQFYAHSHYVLQWYQDQIQAHLPTIWVLSVPLYVYRILMLLWALWLSFSLLNWFQWAWKSFAKDGLWKKETKDKTIISG